MKKKYIVPRIGFIKLTAQPFMAGSNTKQSVRNSIGTDDYSNFEKPITEVGWDDGEEDSYAKGFTPVGKWNDSWEDE
jgi:hypothetical protein